MRRGANLDIHISIISSHLAVCPRLDWWRKHVSNGLHVEKDEPSMLQLPAIIAVQQFPPTLSWTGAFESCNHKGFAEEISDWQLTVSFNLCLTLIIRRFLMSSHFFYCPKQSIEYTKIIETLFWNRLHVRLLFHSLIFCFQREKSIWIFAETWRTEICMFCFFLQMKVFHALISLNAESNHQGLQAKLHFNTAKNTHTSQQQLATDVT